MLKPSINVVLLLAFLLSVSLNWMIRPDASLPNFEFLPEMVHSPAYRAYSENPIFVDGKTLQAPQPGTIARGWMPLAYKATPEDAESAGRELLNPVETDEDVLSRGNNHFRNFCAVCHGVKGLGDGPVALRGVPPPPSLLADNARSLKDGQIFHLLTYGQKNMPAYAAQLSPQQRWEVIHYVRVLQQAGEEEP